MEQKDIFELYKRLREEKQVQFNRVLPLNELVGDRWEKAQFLNFGERTSIYDSSIVIGEVEVGKDTWIGPETLLDGSGAKLSIGDECNISAGVQIYTHDTVKACVSGNPNLKRSGEVIVEKNCYIGPMSIISLGVFIGAHSVVAANSFVNKSFPAYSIIGGTPAKQIGKVVIEKDGVIFDYDKKYEVCKDGRDFNSCSFSE